MSAWMFTDEAIHRLVVALRVDRFFFDRGRHELGAELIMMNEAAVNARYSENSRRNEPYIWRNPAPFSAVQAYKTIRCYLYQCSEGEVPEKWPLYAQVTEVRKFYSELLGHDHENDRWSKGQMAADYRDAEWN
jgi:hypothetical protein